MNIIEQILEEEINKFRTIFKNECDPRIIGEIANHFVKWQKEQDDKEFSKKIVIAYQLGLADKEKQIMKETMEGWVAVDSDTDGKRRVTFFPQKPVRDVLTEYKYWAATRPRYESIKLDSNAFPNLKWEDEPKKVCIIIVKENEKRVQNN